MIEIISAAASLDDLATKIKIKLAENAVVGSIKTRNVIEIDEMLTQAKKLLKHGQFQFWLEKNFSAQFKLTDRTARTYMKIADYFGKNGFFKTEEFFHFPAYVLAEMVKLTKNDLKDFTNSQAFLNFNISDIGVLSIRNTINQWKNPAPTQKSVVTVDAEIKTAPADASPLKLPPPSFSTVPTILQAAADEAGIEIEMDFSRALQLPDADIFLSPLNLSTLQKYSSVAASVIFTKMDFVSSDGVVKKRQCCIWYFGGNSETFAKYFSQFGEVINLQKQKSPPTSPGINLN